MKKFYLVAITIVLLSFSAFAKKGVDITVPLSPAGSFQIESKKISGKIKKTGADSYQAKKISIKVKHMKSGMDLRDEHLKNKDRLYMKKYPKIDVLNIKAKGGRGIGTIRIKGVKQKIKFKYSASGKTMTAKFRVDLSKFPLKKLKYLGVGVKRYVKVEAFVPISK